MNKKTEDKEGNSDYVYRLLQAEKHENELLRARIESMLVENASYTSRQQFRKIIDILVKNKFAVLLLIFFGFLMLLVSSAIAQFIITRFF